MIVSSTVDSAASTETRWLGQVMTVMDGLDEATLQKEIQDNYWNNLKQLRIQGYNPVGSPIFYDRPASYMDPLMQVRQVGWKQQFTHVGEFKAWLEEFKKEQQCLTSQDMKK